MKKLLKLATFATGFSLLLGCASSGYKKADSASSSLQAAAQSIDSALGPLDDAVAALSDLVKHPNPDITKQFQKFSASVGRLELLQNELNTRTTAMQTQGADYFQKWDKELAKIQNNNIQISSLERKNAVAAQFERVHTSYVQTTSDFAPFMSNLKDIRTALSTDLTAGGLDSVRDLANAAADKAIPLRTSLTNLSAEFKNLGMSISPNVTAQ